MTPKEKLLVYLLLAALNVLIFGMAYFLIEGAVSQGRLQIIMLVVLLALVGFTICVYDLIRGLLKPA